MIEREDRPYDEILYPLLDSLVKLSERVCELEKSVDEMRYHITKLTVFLERKWPESMSEK